MRWPAITLVLLSFACVSTTSVTRTGTGLFAPSDNAEEEEENEAPAGLSLSVESIASDGTAVLVLRNYSSDTFVFYGSPERPKFIVEEQSGNTHARHVVSSWKRGQKTHEVPAGDRIQLTANLGMGPGRVRIGIRHHEFGYIVWTSWIPR